MKKGSFILSIVSLILVAVLTIFGYVFGGVFLRSDGGQKIITSLVFLPICLLFFVIDAVFVVLGFIGSVKATKSENERISFASKIFIAFFILFAIAVITLLILMFVLK